MPLLIMVGDAFRLDLLAINVSTLADFKTSSFIVKASHSARKSLEPLQIFDLWFSSPHKKEAYASFNNGGRCGTRTHDPHNVNVMRYQLR